MWILILLFAVGVLSPSFAQSAEPLAAAPMATPMATRTAVWSVGATMGGMLGPTQLVAGGSPSAAVAWERGRGRVRLHTGFSTAPTFLWVAGPERLGATLAMFDLGVTVGTDRLRVGPYGTIGLLGVGGGLRFVNTSRPTRKGHLRGVEARIGLLAPRTGSVSVHYAVARARRVAERVPAPERGRFCHRFSTAVGVAVAVSSTARSWDFVGSSESTVTTGSPALSVACESGGRAGSWLLGVDSAPWAAYRVPTNDGGADRVLHPMGAVTLGASVGGDGVRIGPMVTAGVWALGAGVRGVVRTARTVKGAQHGFELRLVRLVPSAPAVQGMLLYQVWFDPRDRDRSG